MTQRISLLLLLSLAGCATSSPGPQAGETLPAKASLALTDMDGKAQDLDAALARGETVALVFWQTWCASCASEAPHVVQAEKAHRGAIRFVGVVPGKAETVDDAKVAATAKQWGYCFPQVRDVEMRLTRSLGVKGTPTILVLRKKGDARVVEYRGHRPPQDWSRYRGEATDAKKDGAECKDGVCPLPSDKPGGKP